MYKKMLSVVILSAHLCVAELPNFSESLHNQAESSQAFADASAPASSFTAEQRAELKDILPVILWEMAQEEKHKAEAVLQKQETEKKELAAKIKNEEALRAQAPGRFAIGAKKVGGVSITCIGGCIAIIWGLASIAYVPNTPTTDFLIAISAAGVAYLGKKLYNSARADAEKRAEILKRLKNI